MLTTLYKPNKQCLFLVRIHLWSIYKLATSNFSKQHFSKTKKETEIQHIIDSSRLPVVFLFLALFAAFLAFLHLGADLLHHGASHSAPVDLLNVGGSAEQHKGPKVLTTLQGGQDGVLFVCTAVTMSMSM